MASGDIFKKVRVGQRLNIPAQTFNAFIDAAQDYRNRQHNQCVDNRNEMLPAGQILVRNDTGSNQDQYNILGINGPVISPTDNPQEFKRQIAIKGVRPTEGTHEGRFVILAGPLKSGSIGPAWISGVCPAYVELADAEHRYVDIIDSATDRLTTNQSSGAELLWRQDGEGAQLALVRLDCISEPSMKMYRRSSDHEDPYTYNATRYTWNPTTANYTSTGETAICFNIAEYGLPSLGYHYLKSSEFMMQVGPVADNGKIPVFACTTIGRWQ